MDVQRPGPADSPSCPWREPGSAAVCGQSRDLSRLPAEQALSQGRSRLKRQTERSEGASNQRME